MASIFGCFVSITLDSFDDTESIAHRQGREFNNFLYKSREIDSNLKSLNSEDYGVDLSFFLFKFYVNPLPSELERLTEIDRFSKTTKSISAVIVIDQNNFFSKSDDDRYKHLKVSMLEKMDRLAEVVKKRKLDTKIEKLKADLTVLLEALH